MDKGLAARDFVFIRAQMASASSRSDSSSGQPGMSNWEHKIMEFRLYRDSTISNKSLASVSFKGYHRQRRCLCCVLFTSVFPQSPHRLSASSPPPRVRRRNEPGAPPGRRTHRPLPCPCCPRGSPQRTQAGCQTGLPPEPENRLSVGFTMASTRIGVMSL